MLESPARFSNENLIIEAYTSSALNLWKIKSGFILI
jgi:hypothetical protein